MLFCRNCGQCSLISDDHFIEYASLSGTETRYLNPTTGDVDDYGDTDTEGTGDSEYNCPHCSNSDIDFDWNGDEEEALELRESYDKEREARTKAIEAMKYNDKTRESEWDLEKNPV